jgi:hypothetical protein
MKLLKTLLFVIVGFASHLFISAQSSNVSPFDTTHFGRNEKVGSYINIHGFKMYYEIYGKGEPLLMIHGNAGSIKSFVYQIPYFSKN